MSYTTSYLRHAPLRVWTDMLYTATFPATSALPMALGLTPRRHKQFCTIHGLTPTDPVATPRIQPEPNQAKRAELHVEELAVGSGRCILSGVGP